MKVRTLKPHWNTHSIAREGADDWAVGETYDHDDPTADIILGHVEDANNNKADRVQGTGTKVDAGKGIDSKEQDAEGSKGVR